MLFSFGALRLSFLHGTPTVRIAHKARASLSGKQNKQRRRPQSVAHSSTGIAVLCETNSGFAAAAQLADGPGHRSVRASAAGRQERSEEWRVDIVDHVARQDRACRWSGVVTARTSAKKKLRSPRQSPGSSPKISRGSCMKPSACGTLPPPFRALQMLRSEMCSRAVRLDEGLTAVDCSGGSRLQQSVRTAPLLSKLLSQVCLVSQN